jgi:hypothetical protein
VRLTERTPLADVAVAVGHELRRAGIRAVLTGGACADLYALGASPSFDADFIVEGRADAKEVERALGRLNFVRRGDRYIHRNLPFHVEFPGGPLAIGQDFSIKPVIKRRKGMSTLALSATDSCRDRLAWFYFNRDRQSLRAAVAITLHSRVAHAKVRAWSLREGKKAEYEYFLRELRRTRTERKTRARPEPRPRLTRPK